MKNILLLIALIICYPLSADPIKTVDTPIDMFVGESKIFEEANIERVAIGASSLITVKELENDRLLIMADQPGSTTVHIWYENKEWAPRVYNIRIDETDPITRVRREQMIRFNVRLVEFRKAALTNLGIDWSKSIDGPAAGIAASVVDNDLFSSPLPESFSGLPNRANGFSGGLGFASAITSRINFLSSNGHASIIAEPILMCLNGGEAEFHAGGEVPLPVRDEDGFTNVQFKPYGIRLSVQPRVNDQGIIDTIISTEVSEIDNSVSVQNIPGFITRNTTTRVQVQHGDTIVLAGLLSEKNGIDKSSIPGLGDTPGVGKAFSNKQNTQQTTEIVIFLQPQVVNREDGLTENTKELLIDQRQLSEWKNKLKNNMVN